MQGNHLGSAISKLGSTTCPYLPLTFQYSQPTLEHDIQPHPFVYLEEIYVKKYVAWIQ